MVDGSDVDLFEVVRKGRNALMKHLADNVFSSILLLLAIIAIYATIPRPDSASASPLVLTQEDAQVGDSENVGARPYEMDWAGRTEEARPALVDFENLDGWKVETNNAVATFEKSREEQMYGQYVGKLTYRIDDPKSGAPSVDILAPEPIAIPSDSDAFSCWIVGNNWGWTTDPKTPRVNVAAIFRASDGQEIALHLATVNWREWFLCYQLIAHENQKRLGEGSTFVGFRVSGGSNAEDRTLYFDSFCVFKEERAPLDIKLRAKPGIDLFEGQSLGVNSGEGRLPFPTTEDTILPDSSKNLRKPAMHFYGNACDFVYEGSDGTLVYDYKPSKGNFSDITARWDSSAPFHTNAGGGVVALINENGESEAVEQADLIELKQQEKGVVARWNLRSKTASAEVEYRLQMKGKSLIVDTIAKGGAVPSVEFGRMEDVVKPRVFAIPYYLYDYGKRPGVAVFKPFKSDVSLFASAHVDWYRSSASYLRGARDVGKYEKDVRVGKPGEFKTEKQAFDFAVLNGAAEYRTKTDGKRNDVYERFIMTVSPDFDETLPSIPNPKSPYRAVAGKGVWHAYGATNRDVDKKLWRDVWRRGARRMIITDHETCWRDGGESFTYRTKPAPGKGGDAGWIDYSRFMQDELGFVYGPYNNFTDFAPVNEYWSPDMINRFSDGSLQHAWMRCYAPKPTRAVEYCEKLTPINQEKFQFSCAYCDVHSSVPAWTRTDYDARVPGAGTFMSVFYPYGEIFLLQKKNWKGPTYSEGPHHCFYAGLTDGNYAQDQPYNMFKNQWLLDFDLLKIHEQEVDFGMGNLQMFAPGYSPKTPEERLALVDRFNAATIAFGHSGFLAREYGWANSARCYFMIQQIASYYTQASVASIRYFNEKGEELDTSAALIADVVKRSQVCVRYSDGTVVVSNGSNDETLDVKVDGRAIKLPPNGYTAWTADAKVLVESFLSDSGKRFDYCESPEYIYIDGRGEWTIRARACGAGAGVCRILENGQFEIIPTDGAELGFKIADENETVAAVALDYDMNELGAVKVRRSRGFVYVEPVENAFSYMLTVTPKKEGEASESWNSPRYRVARCETIQTTNGTQTVDWSVPQDAPMGHIWAEPSQGCFVDFDVVPFADVAFEYEGARGANELKRVFSSRLPSLQVCGKIEFEAQKFEFNGELRGEGALGFGDALTPPTQEGEEVANASLEYVSGDAQGSERYELKFETKSAFVPFEQYKFDGEESAARVTPYVQVRGREATTVFEGTNATKNYSLAESCGDVSKACWCVHPPYAGGIGRTMLRCEFKAPDEPSTIRLSVGKRDGSDVGDGIKFQIAVVEFDEAGALIPETEKTLAETVLKEHAWAPLEADLTEYAGKELNLLLIADAGENPNGDWARIADVRIESTKKTLVRTLKSAEKIEENAAKVK